MTNKGTWGGGPQGTCTRMRTFLCERPPLVIFVLCLGMFAIALLALSRVINNREIEMQDAGNITKDWNDVLTSLSKLEFCVFENLSRQHDVTTPESTTELSKTTLKPDGNGTLSSIAKSEMVTASVSMIVTINTPATMTKRVDFRNFSSVVGTFHLAELTQVDSDNDIFRLHIAMPDNWTRSACPATGCKTIKIDTCVSFLVPSHILSPHGAPDQCEFNSSGAIFFSLLKAKRTGDTLTDSCRQKPKLRFDPKPDYQQLYLSEADKTMINLHLMHTSYFVFATMAFFLFYGIFKRKPMPHHTAEQKQTLM